MQNQAENFRSGVHHGICRPILVVESSTAAAITLGKTPSSLELQAGHMLHAHRVHAHVLLLERFTSLIG